MGRRRAFAITRSGSRGADRPRALERPGGATRPLRRAVGVSSAGSVRRASSVGAWPSLVGRIVRDDEVGGSNPLAPTIFETHRSRTPVVRLFDAFASRAILERVTDPLATDETRIDRWLCAVRLVKTRPLATRLCDGGHVLVNGSPAKPSTKVRAGDRVEALIADRERIVEVMLADRVACRGRRRRDLLRGPQPASRAGGRASDHARTRGGPAEQAPAARVGAPAPGSPAPEPDVGPSRYTPGMKTAVSVPDDLFAQVDRLARRSRRSRSEVYSAALREYVARHAPDEVTARLDAVMAEAGDAESGDIPAAPRGDPRVERLRICPGRGLVGLHRRSRWAEAGPPAPAGQVEGDSSTRSRRRRCTGADSDEVGDAPRVRVPARPAPPACRSRRCYVSQLVTIDRTAPRSGRRLQIETLAALVGIDASTEADAGSDEPTPSSGGWLLLGGQPRSVPSPQGVRIVAHRLVRVRAMKCACSRTDARAASLMIVDLLFGPIGTVIGAHVRTLLQRAGYHIDPPGRGLLTPHLVGNHPAESNRPSKASNEVREDQPEPLEAGKRMESNINKACAPGPGQPAELVYPWSTWMINDGCSA